MDKERAKELAKETYKFSQAFIDVFNTLIKDGVTQYAALWSIADLAARVTVQMQTGFVIGNEKRPHGNEIATMFRRVYNKQLKAYGKIS